MDINLLIKEARPGDIVLTGSKGLISAAIKYAQKPQTLDKQPSRWSHAFIYCSPQTIAESTLNFTNNGPCIGTPWDYRDATDGLLLSFPFSDYMRMKVISTAYDIITKHLRYPVTGLIGSLLSYWLLRCGSNPLQSKHALYCSAYVQEVYTTIGLDFDQRRTARNTSPEMISQYQMNGLRKIELAF